MKKTFRSLTTLALSAWAVAASAAVYVPTDQAVAPRSPLVSQFTDHSKQDMASYTGDTKNAPTKKMADARTPDKVMASRTPAVTQADAHMLFGKTVDSRTLAMFKASAQGAKKHDTDVGGDQQVALTGSSPPSLHLKQVWIETGRVTPQPSTDVGARSRMAVVI